MKRGDTAAVMARRHADYGANLDYYPTPPFATTALCNFLKLRHELGSMLVHEPAAGGGHMVEVLNNYFWHVFASDVADYGQGYMVADYLTMPQPHKWEGSMKYADWIITNPPFALAERFIRRAIHQASVGVAMLCRLQFLETTGRWARLFVIDPPTDVLVFSSRLTFAEGKIGDKRQDRSAASYAWFVWDKVQGGGASPRLEWIPPEGYHNRRLF